MDPWEDKKRKRKAYYKWRNNNPEYIRYHRALIAAKSFVDPKGGTKMEAACQWGNQQKLYLADLKELKDMIDQKIQEIS